MINNIYNLWKIYCTIRAVHGVFITICFFRWIFGKSYSSIIMIFSYFYEKKEKKEFLTEEKDDFILLTEK